ncbi:MAG: acyl-CoA dehydrogenase family protein, partial [bacterium]
MDFSLNEEQKLLQKTVRDYVEENIGPKARELDEQGHGSRETMTELMELGVGGVFIPEEYNGVGMGFLERALVLEVRAREAPCMPVTWPGVPWATMPFWGRPRPL